MIDFQAYVIELLGRHRAHPDVDDLTSALLAAEVEGDRLSDEELVATCILVLNAGHEATVQAIGNSLLALARNPEAYAALRTDPGLMRTAVDELLRFDTPLQMFERWVLEDLEWDGVALRRGSKVGLLFGSANHDDTRFSRAAELVLDRRDNPHVSFGGGIHFCVGAPLAKVEMEVALDLFSRRVRSFELVADHVDRIPSLVFRGVRRLPIRLSG
jgi:cytochrome P450